MSIFINEFGFILVQEKLRHLEENFKTTWLKAIKKEDQRNIAKMKLLQDSDEHWSQLERLVGCQSTRVIKKPYLLEIEVAVLALLAPDQLWSHRVWEPSAVKQLFAVAQGLKKIKGRKHPAPLGKSSLFCFTFFEVISAFLVLVLHFQTSKWLSRQPAHP